MSTLYRGPLGDSVVNPAPAFLRQIADKPADYWKTGGGDSCLEVSGKNERLLFFFGEPFGFFMMMHPDYDVVVRKSGPVQTIVHRVGGEPMKVPSCSYFSRDDAYALMLEFLQILGRPTSVEWRDMYQIEFDHSL